MDLCVGLGRERLIRRDQRLRAGCDRAVYELWNTSIAWTGALPGLWRIACTKLLRHCVVELNRRDPDGPFHRPRGNGRRPCRGDGGGRLELRGP